MKMNRFGKLLRRADVEERTALSCSSIYRKMRSGSFPLPIRLGSRAVRWSTAEIDIWLASQPRAEGDCNSLGKSRKSKTRP